MKILSACRWRLALFFHYSDVQHNFLNMFYNFSFFVKAPAMWIRVCYRYFIKWCRADKRAFRLGNHCWLKSRCHTTVYDITESDTYSISCTSLKISNPAGWVVHLRIFPKYFIGIRQNTISVCTNLIPFKVQCSRFFHWLNYCENSFRLFLRKFSKIEVFQFGVIFLQWRCFDVSFLNTCM